MSSLKEILAAYIGILLAIVMIFVMEIPVIYIIKFFAYVYNIII